MTQDTKKMQSFYGVRIDSPKTIETCLALGINPNLFSQQIISLDSQDNSLSQKLLSHQQQKIQVLAKEVIQTRDRMNKSHSFLFSKDPLLIKQVKKNLEDPEIARTFDFSRVMKEYILENKSLIMKMFKKDLKNETENELKKSDEFSVSFMTPQMNYEERYRLSLERNQKL